jgi:tetratricopeptide (TPR) repeat protein
MSFAVAAAAVLCFINILFNDFCYDAVPVVRDNPKVQQDGQWRAIWSTDYWSQMQSHWPHRDLLYRPVTVSLFRLTRFAFGPSPLPFHVISLGLHALCSVLVLRLVWRLSGSIPPALIAGLAFAVLPIHTEVVAGVVGQADLLATGGVVGAVLCHIRASVSLQRSRQTAWMMAAGASAFVAMGAKESGISVVAVVALLTALGIPKPAGPKEGLARRLLRCGYIFVPLGAYLLLRYQALGGVLHQIPAPTKTVNVLVDAPAWQHTLGVLQAWGLYWAKTFLPRELCIEYAINAVRLATGVWQAHVLIGVAWVAGLAALAYRGLKRNRRDIVFLVGALVLAYLPTSNAIVLIQVFFAERIWYLPSVFVCALLGLAAGRRLDRKSWRVLGIALLVGMVARCWVRNLEWRNNGTLFAAAYQDHPQSVMARYLYGQWLAQNGREEQGIALLEGAIQIDLGFTDAHRALGLAWLRLGHHENALQRLQIAQMQVPGDPITAAALADATAAAATRIRELEESAGTGDAATQLASIRLLRDLGRGEQALRLLEERADRNPTNPEWAYETAVTLVTLNRRDDAIAAYRRVLDLKPIPHAQAELAMLLIERRSGGDVDEASQWVDRALESRPDLGAFHAARGEVQALQGDLRGARDSFRKALSLTPRESGYYGQLRERMKALGFDE